MIKSNLGAVRAIVTITALFFSFSANCARAQSADNSDIGVKDSSQPTEIIIHGAPFTAPLQDVPQSTTVVPEQRFIEKGEIAFQDEIEAIPSMMWSGGTARP